MTDRPDSIIARKINALGVGRSPIAQIGRIGENFASIVDEKMRGLLKCITSSIILECEVKRLATVLEELPVPAMLAAVDVDGCEAGVLLNIENDLVFHVVDLRMGGDPEVSPTPTARSFTVIDTELCRGFVEVALSCLGEALRLGLDADVTPTLRLDHFEQHVSMVRIAPENADVLLINLSLDIGDAARNGCFDVIIPLSALDHFISGAKFSAPKATTRARGDRWARHMATAAARSRVRLYSVLHRAPMTVHELRALAPGQTIALPETAVGDVALMFEGAGEACIARGRLGAFEGRKALKLHTPPDSEFLARIEDLITPDDTT